MSRAAIHSLAAGVWRHLLCMSAACVVAAVTAAEPFMEDDPLQFLRVHVPHGKLAEIDLGRERYVPMSADEFAAGVARALGEENTAGGPAGLGALADSARYVAALEFDRRDGPAAGQPALVGTASWTMREVASSRALSVGELQIGRVTMRTAAGTGDALVFGKADGTLGIVTPEPGDYDCDWRCEALSGTADAWTFRLPLVPALASAVELRLPSGLRPMVTGVDVQPVLGGDDSAGMTAWRIAVGPRRLVTVVVVPVVDDVPETPKCRVWSDVAVRGREARLVTLIEPVDAWRHGMGGSASDDGLRIRLAVPGDLMLAAVRVRDAENGLERTIEWTRRADATTIDIVMPIRSVGSRDAVVVEALAPVEQGRVRPLPLLGVSGSAWAGGGVVLRIDAALVVSRLDVEGGLVVPPDVAGRWPAPLRAAGEDETQPGVRPARIFIEQQRAQALVHVMLEPRIATTSVNQLTVVDLSPGTTLGRVTCDVSVARGEAFEVRGRLARGWVLDTVEALTPTDTIGESPEWKVVRDGADDVVRIAFAAAISPRRGITLRLSGHRAGVPAGVDVTSSELDMVRLDGETRAAVLAVKTGPDMTIDLVGTEPTLAAGEAAIAAQATDTSIRVRLPVGRRAAERVMRLVRRRPPIDARTQVWITSRDGRLAESFTFECSPQRTDIDAIVVHFSTVMDDRLEWSLLPPATGALAARRIDPPDRRDGRSGEPIADSWIVELPSPARDTVTIRAVATVPFTGPTPLPLAWVEGATHQGGIVSIREAGRYRPRVVNRRLEELPPSNDPGDQAGVTVAEFAFDPARGRPDDPLAAADIIPGGSEAGDDARAWAWREVNMLWCHASGTIESETRFEVENHGRSSVTLAVPEALRVQGVRVNGEMVARGVSGTGGGEVTVELPVGQRFVEIVVQSLATHDSGLGLWRIDPHAVALDVPVLQRESRLLLAPDVAIARVAGAYRVVDDREIASVGWAERLFGASLRPAGGASVVAEPTNDDPRSGLSPSGNVVEGYRARTLLPIVGRRGGGGVLLVRRALVDAAAILAAALAFIIALAVPAARAWFVPWACALAAAGALWVAVPFDAVFRAACWAAVGGLTLRAGGGGLRSAGAVVILATCPTSLAPAAEPLRVYLTPVDASGAGGETALVPEALFRALSRAAAEPASVRVIACDIMARPPSSSATNDDPPWKLRIDVDADAGGTFVCDQSDSGAVIAEQQAVLDGAPLPLRVERGGRLATAVVPTAGRHRIELSIRPAVARRGDIEETAAVVPCAAVGRLSLTASEEAATVICERASAGGVFQSAVPLTEPLGRSITFDISRATVVRLSRPVDPRLRVAAGVRSVSSRNDVFWDLDACRLVATFDVDAGNEVVRSFVISADPGLVPTGDDPGLRAIGPDRYLFERAAPVRGRWTVQVPFRMPLPDPVGVFAVPGAWVANAAADARTTLFVPAPDLAFDVSLPEGMAAATRENDLSLQGFAWRADVVQPLGGSQMPDAERLAASVTRSQGRPVVTVERRSVRPRATQQLTVEFDLDQVRLGLQSRIDATSTALSDIQIDVPADCLIERVELVEDRGLQADATDRGPVDIRWSRVDPTTLLAVMQRPRAGRFRLDVDARLSGRPPSRGTLPVMRAALAGSVPMTVEWRTAAGRGATMRASYGEPIDLDRPATTASERLAAGMLELAGGETSLVYEVGDVESASSPGPQPVLADGLAPAVTRDARVEWADVFLDIDGRGRAWGTVRFDLVAVTPAVRLALPEGMRLFEVLVDGRAVATVPQEDGTWLVSMFGVRWPRSLVAVFAGDAAAEQAAGSPFVIASPKLVGLPCRQVAWTLRLAPGLTARVAEPTHAVDAATIAAARQAAAERLEDDFIRAVEESDATERARMTDFARLRRTGTALPVEAAWARSMATVAGGEMLHVLMDVADDAEWPALLVRVGKAADPTAATRAIATLGVITVCAVAWNVAARWPRGRRRSIGWAVPLVVALAGVVWLLLFDPVWPGWGMLTVAAALVVMQRRDQHRPPADIGGDSTITQFMPSAAAASSTRTFFTSGG